MPRLRDNHPTVTPGAMSIEVMDQPADGGRTGRQGAPSHHDIDGRIRDWRMQPEREDGERNARQQRKHLELTLIHGFCALGNVDVIRGLRSLQHARC
jgi:hypothetical protein